MFPRLDSYLVWFPVLVFKTNQLGSSGPQSCPTLCEPMDCSTPGLPVLHQLPELAQIRVHCVSDAIQPAHPLSSPSPPAFNISQHQGLFWVSSLHQVAKGLEFGFSISPSNEYWGLISFMFDWFDLLAVQGTLKSIQHGSKHNMYLNISSLLCLSFTFSRQSNYWVQVWKIFSIQVEYLLCAGCVSDTGHIVVPKPNWNFCPLLLILTSGTICLLGISCLHVYSCSSL